MSAPTTLYRLWDADETLLYIGIAGNPGRRFEQHRNDKPWWGHVAQITLEHFPTRQAACAAEMDAIRSEGPLHNIVGNRGIRRPQEPAPGDPNNWIWHSRSTGHEWTGSLHLFWRMNYSAITDEFYPLEITAGDLWDEWRYTLHRKQGWSAIGEGWVDIVWSVVGTHTCEYAPFQELFQTGSDFLRFFHWPRHAITNELLNWHQLPIPDLRWNVEDGGDSGGFIQEMTGWKPSPLQPCVHVPTLARAAGL